MKGIVLMTQHWPRHKHNCVTLVRLVTIISIWCYKYCTFQNCWLYIMSGRNKPSHYVFVCIIFTHHLCAFCYVWWFMIPDTLTLDLLNLDSIKPELITLSRYNLTTTQSPSLEWKQLLRKASMACNSSVYTSYLRPPNQHIMRLMLYKLTGSSWTHTQ